MVTEGFINSCFSVILCQSDIRKDKVLYRDILNIVEFSEKQKSVEIPVTIQTKVDCLKKMCTLLLEDRQIDNVLDSILVSKKFEKIEDFITLKSSETINSKVNEDNIRQIRLRKKLNNLFSNIDNVEHLLETVKNGSFDSIDDVVLDYEKVVKLLYSNLMEEQRIAMVEATSSLDLAKDNFDRVKEQIINKYQRTNTTPTGYSVFDNEILNGGFEPSRLYVFGGGSGSGKSTILNNFITNVAIKDNITQLVQPTEKNKDHKNVFVLVTMENTIEESFLRIYQDVFEKSTTTVLREIGEGIDIRSALIEKLEKNNATIVMKYFKPKQISCIDLMMVLDDVSLEYGREAIKGLYVDYLDLMTTDLKYDLYRIQLGDIALGLKSLAVEYNIPVITVTQLNKSAYRTESAHDLNLDQMSESIKKVEHADFIALMIKDKKTNDTVFMNIAKNRCGPSNISLEFKVNFDYYRFKVGIRVKNGNKSDYVNNSNNDLFSFSGFNGL